MVDVIFLIVYGMLGEDGFLQGMLWVVNLLFVGFDVLVLAVCMDKDVIKCLLCDVGLNIVLFIILMCVNCYNISFVEVEFKLGLLLFVKLVNQGFFVGVSKVISEEQYVIVVDLVFEFDYKVIVE